ncbi:hypothetical protein G6011_06820 [Alternaria panax]|uniref:Uncharacterized protein n=1 Tax=Alternaria panax TaxID=48097 RepID=A0AAD4FH62_9PLEO|nr:hypothetical protein G6011_06820 [Alternaria panax]
MEVVPHSGLSESFTITSGTASCCLSPVTDSRFSQLSKAEQARETDQLEHVRKLEAERDRLEVELHMAQTAYVQICATLMEEKVKWEDLSCPSSESTSANIQSPFRFSPTQKLDVAGSYLPSRKCTAADVALSIPSKRPCTVSGESDLARPQKRRRYK